MRIVKISELSEEEKRKIKQRQEENAKAREQLRIDANNKFNELIKKKEQETTQKTKTSLWQDVQNLAGDIGRSNQNLILGASSGAKQSFNYGFKTAESKYKTEQRAKNERVLGSKELSDSDKAIYIAGSSQNRRKNNVQDINLPIRSIIGYDKEKVEEIANKNILDKSIEKDQAKIQENIDSQSNNITKKIAELAPSIGNMGVGAALSAVNPALGAAYFTTSAGGSYIQDAEERGMTREEAVTYGSIMGLMEGATEAIGWGNLSKAGKGLKTLIKGTSKTVAKEGIEQVTKSSIKSILKDYGVGIAENAIQELLIEPIQEITAGAIGGKDKANWNDIGQRMLKAGIDGGLTSAIVGGANLGIESCIGVVEKTQKGQGITNQELQSAVKDASKQLDVEKMITDSTQQQIQKHQKQQNTYKDYNTNKTLNKDSQNWLKQAEDIVSQNKSSNLESQLPQEQKTTSTQQVTPSKQPNTQNEISNQVKIDSDNFAKQVDAVKDGTFPQRDMLTLGKTPQVLKDIGLPDLPITMTQKHLDTIMNKTGKYAGANYHDLGIDIVKQLPEAINNPLDIVKSNTKDNSIVLTTYLADKQDRTIIASIKMNGKGTINDIRIDTNVMTSAYGRNNYEKFMEENIKNGNLLYDIDRGVLKKVTGERLQLPMRSNFSSTDARFQLPRGDATINNSVPQNTKNVNDNTSTNYSMQESEKNSGSLNLPTNENNPETTANILEHPAEKIKEKDRTLAIAKANLIDKGIIFEELSRKTKNRELQGKWDYTLTSSARGQNAIGNARYELNPNSKTQKQISKSLTDIINEVGENTVDFYNYMYHQLNIDRMTLEERFNGDTGINYERKKAVKNKPVFGKGVTAEHSRKYVQELEKRHPEFKKWAQDVYDYLDANTKELVYNGVISKETQELFKEMYPHYVPISRVTNKGLTINVPLDTGRTGINSPIKKATGGNRDISPLFETMADRTLQTYRATARNSFGVELKKSILQNKQSNQASEQVDIDTIMENMTNEERNEELLQEGKNGQNPTFTVFENGNKVTYEINKDMYDALKPKNELLSKIDESKFSKIANKINNFRRGLLTEYNPVFSITNAIKDVQDVLLNSQHSAKTYAKIPEATAQLLSKGYWYNEYVQNGGAQNSYFKDGEFEVTKNNLPTKLKNTVTFPLRAISNINNVIEMAPRLAEYIVSREQGRSIQTSMLDAARVTTNFKAGGDITKTLNRNGFTFLNASVQGMQQQIRNIQEANAKGLKGYAILACKYAIAAAPVLLLNNLIWKDDEDYEELQDYAKDNYYIIGKLPNGKFLRIPKGRAVATIQKIVSNANDFVKNDTINSDEVGKVFWQDLKEDVQFGIENLAPNNPLENNILSPLFQAITNKTWYGEDLVPSRLQKKPSEEQYDETTDKFSRWLGEKTGISPIKINYLIDQYSGGVGDVLLPLGTPQAENNVIEDKFTTDAIMKNKYPGEFFAKVDELEINKNSSKATDEDLLKYKYISSISTDIGKLYTKKREIQNSSATDKEKKEQLKEVQKEINELAKNSLEHVENITKTDTTAMIGNSEYYKYKGEWRVLSEDEKEKTKGISLKTYADYQNKVAKISEQKKIQDESITKSDKVDILVSSSYSNYEKDKIYSQIIDKNDKVYNTLKKLDSSKSIINQYLDYLQADLSADRTDDGTKKGKAISGSKRQKVYNYINNISSSKLSYTQRLFLTGINTTLSDSDKYTIYKLIKNNNSLTDDEKLEVIEQLNGFTVYTNGTIKF